ncbi:DUF4153 domain-containing protein [Salmonirosea aquatica]|uniref:DUF4153 domain-containing protein n=1 Tax=Salmonirosea aquatica TaxID=2654236 RepID=A0A7C9BBS0_9BACT|nr:DUF4153 domain-containing protein [Cytophagaceae bacterium SJW1-29]
MKTEILSNLDNPQQLEKLYRDNKSAFRQAFNALYPQLNDTRLAEFWHQRLNFDRDEVFSINRSELIFVLVAALIAGTCAKLPQILSIDEEFFYTRNLGFLVFPFLSAYFIRKNNLTAKTIAIIAGLMGMGLVYINLLPDNPKSDTLVLSCIHLGVFLWATTGFAFTGGNARDLKQRLGYLRYNGDLVVMSTLLLISGGILTAITIGLFNLIGYDIREYYFQYIVIFGLPAVPLVGTVLTQNIPELVQKVSPIIARIFSPLVLIMLLAYLGAIVFSGKDPYNDREFLIIFNALLVGVMALIFFSVAERAKATSNRFEIMVLFLLSVVTILVNGIALSAIVFRISEWGITPNRMAVLGANVLMLIHLMFIASKLVKVLTRDASLTQVGKSISAYLPIYWGWTAVVTFLFPLLFGFE